MAKMNYNRQQRVRLKADFLRLILGAGIDPARRSLLVEFIETYMLLGAEEKVQFQQVVKSKRQYRKVEQMITTYEQEGIKKGIEKGIEQGIEKGIEQGIQKGIEKGIEQGMIQAKQNVLMILLEKKFRKLKAAEKRRIRGIDSPDRLDALLLAVLDARSLDDLEF